MTDVDIEYPAHVKLLGVVKFKISKAVDGKIRLGATWIRPDANDIENMTPEEAEQVLSMIEDIRNYGMFKYSKFEGQEEYWAASDRDARAALIGGSK